MRRAHAAAFLFLLWLTAAAQAAESRIALRVPEWTGADRDEVVTAGVPLTKGTLPEAAQCRLLDEQGKEAPFVGTALARWPDGSVKWLLLDFRARVGAGKTANFTLECGTSASAKITGERVSIAETKNSIEV
ncbi:MAG: hypothetical protein FJ272_17455, partial [Planctomycetes bacterium]|nr:hypothetical protein [Planctomycetota bacterium]